MSLTNCFLVLRNKKINDFDCANNVIYSFAETGYYFDKISYVAYDSSEEIVRAVKDAKENYENLVIFCPVGMDSTLKGFISALFGSSFDGLNILNCGNSSVFILYSDCENRLKFSDIKAVLDAKYGLKYERTYIKSVGAPLALIDEAVKAAKTICPELGFNIKDSYGDSTIEIVYSDTTSKMALDSAVREMLTKLNDYVYAMENIKLAERLYQLLKLRRMKISVAESFTGGGVGKRLVDIAGISEVYIEGLNTYANESKMYRLGVKELTLIQHGAVSEETAYEMAAGLIKSGNCDISISTTGIAGPKSDNTAKPVGLIYIGIGTQDNVSVYKYNLRGNRDYITNTAINLALFHAYQTIK